MLKRLRILSYISIAALAAVLTSCDSSSNEESSSQVVRSLDADQFNSGLYAIRMQSTHGPDIQIVPSAGGANGEMRVGSASVQVTLNYAVDAVDNGVPSEATLDVEFVDPSASSMSDLLRNLGVTLAKDEEGAEQQLAAGASISFTYSFSPYASVPAKVDANPSAEFDEVYASWTSFDGPQTVGQTLGSWVLLDMLQTHFSIKSLSSGK